MLGGYSWSRTEDPGVFWPGTAVALTIAFFLISSVFVRWY